MTTKWGYILNILYILYIKKPIKIKKTQPHTYIAQSLMIRVQQFSRRLPIMFIIH